MHKKQQQRIARIRARIGRIDKALSNANHSLIRLRLRRENKQRQDRLERRIEQLADRYERWEERLAIAELR